MNRKSILVCLLAPLALSATVVAAQEPVTIRLGTWAGADEASELNAIIDDINANNTASRSSRNRSLPTTMCRCRRSLPVALPRPDVDGPGPHGAGGRWQLPAADRMRCGCACRKRVTWRTITRACCNRLPGRCPLRSALDCSAGRRLLQSRSV